MPSPTANCAQEMPFFHAVAVGALVESLLARGADADIEEADTQVQRLARAAQADSGLAVEEIWLLRSRALLARRTAATPPTATIGIATARWPQSLASKGTLRSPRRWHDSGRRGPPRVSK